MARFWKGKDYTGMPAKDVEVIWAMRSPLDDDFFAQASWHGTWSKGKACSVCDRSTSKRVGPLLIEWESGSNVVADFTWLGFGMEAIIQDRVRRILVEKYGFRAFECLPIEMVEAPWRQRARAKATARRKSTKIVELPYEGPPLWELRPTAIIPMDRARSKFRYSHCEACGAEGFEAVDVNDKTETVVAAPDVNDVEIFRIDGAGVFISCKDVVKQAIEAEGFTNIRFSQWGVILPGERSPNWTPPTTPASVQPAHTPLPSTQPDLPPIKLTDGRVIRAEDLPDDLDELRSWRISFSELSEDERRRHHEFLEELLDYLHIESGCDDLTGEDLTFVRSAMFGDSRYWIWSFEETTGTSYATVQERPDGGHLSYNYNEGFGLSPEQFLLADYFGLL